ncbi:MAG: hypothetical protein RQ930_03570 [Candidatus Aenigmarchaeota archaeon]|jgi:hypothetical protein|nr:hypothetical protein [Candidatus Aenigmarchaeota archaeon]
MRRNSESDLSVNYHLYTTNDIDSFDINSLLWLRYFYMTDNREKEIKKQIRGEQGEQHEICIYNTPQTYKGNLFSLLREDPKRVYGYIRKNKVIKRHWL